MVRRHTFRIHSGSYGRENLSDLATLLYRSAAMANVLLNMSTASSWKRSPVNVRKECRRGITLTRPRRTAAAIIFSGELSEIIISIG